MRNASVYILLVLSYLAIAQPCLSQSEPLTAEIKMQTVDDLSALLPERYAYREVGEKLKQLLQQNLKNGKYDSYNSPQEFSEAVTKDLRSLRPDRHLALTYSPEVQIPSANPTPTPTPLSPEERAKRVSEFNRQMNFGFKSVRFLNGNIGYLKFDYFDSFLNYSSPVVDASMAFFTNSDALIIDLRDNGGGSGEMVAYIAGFFFRDRTLTGASYNRLTDTTTDEFITPQPKEKQLADVDLYVLTSKSTVSAAEGLAYNLKYLKGAKVIGETSAGAANPGRTTRLNRLFTAFVPNRHGKHVVTGTNWEGTGVPVDIPAPAEDALRIGNIEALKRLQQKSTSAFKKAQLGKYITFLERTHPETVLPRRKLLQYAGTYQGGRTVALRNGELHYSRIAEAGGKLYYISPDVFMLAEGDVTVTFKRDVKGKVLSIETLWSLSDLPASAKKLN